jgi:hypothetical protein
MRLLSSSVLLSFTFLVAACDASIDNQDCAADGCEEPCAGDSCEQPTCPLDCRRLEDPAECGDPCEEPEPAPPQCDLPTQLETFETGTGEVCYEQLAEDSVVPYMEGPQGGYHLFLALACADCGTEVIVETEARLEETDEVVSALTQSLVPVKGGTATGIIVPLPGDPWDPESVPLAEGTRLMLSTTVKAPNGNMLHAADELRVLGPEVYWDYCATHPEDQCCIDLCDGL